MEDSKLFIRLKNILKQFELHLTLQEDTTENYYLNTPIADTKKKAEFFGAVQKKKSYVAFHLMPIYFHPDMITNLSPDLKNRMQGKSCFNFKEIDEDLFKELNDLTKTAFKKYKSLKKV
jgi:hypothetical protein